MSIIDRTESLFAGYSRLRQFARYSIGRFLGTTTSTDSRYVFLLDLAESKLIQRSEINGMARLLLDKGVITQAEWSKAMEDEIVLAEKDLRAIFPEVRPEHDGRSYSLDILMARKRMDEEGWPK